MIRVAQTNGKAWAGNFTAALMTIVSYYAARYLGGIEAPTDDAVTEAFGVLAFAAINGLVTHAIVWFKRNFEKPAGEKATFFSHWAVGLLALVLLAACASPLPPPPPEQTPLEAAKEKLVVAQDAYAAAVDSLATLVEDRMIGLETAEKIEVVRASAKAALDAAAAAIAEGRAEAGETWIEQAQAATRRLRAMVAEQRGPPGA